MPLPVRACSDEELEGYAPIEPDAAAELARRIAEGSAERDAELRSVQEESRNLESECDDLRDQLRAARREVSKLCSQLRELISEVGMAMDSRQKISDVITALEGAV